MRLNSRGFCVAREMWDFAGAFSRASRSPAIYLFPNCKSRDTVLMREHLGVPLWQAVLLYAGPPLIIGVAVIWRAVWRATTHPDQKLLKREARKQK